MKEEEIKRAIKRRVMSSPLRSMPLSMKYSTWTIGITDDPDRRKGEHGNPEYWMQWSADTETIARNVEKYFLDKGMKGGPKGGEHLNWVYIF